MKTKTAIFGRVYILRNPRLDDYEDRNEMKTIIADVENIDIRANYFRDAGKVRSKQVQVLMPIKMISIDSRLDHLIVELLRSGVVERIAKWTMKERRNSLRSSAKWLQIKTVNRSTPETTEFLNPSKFFLKNFMEFYICVDLIENTRVLKSRVIFDTFAYPC